MPNIRFKKIGISLLALIACAFLFLAIYFGSDLAKSNKLPQEIVDAFSGAQQVTLYSIEPIRAPQSSEGFQGYTILRNAKINSDDAKRVLDDMQLSLNNWEGGVAMCFEPHHGLRIQKNGHVYDLLICYLCGGLQVYKDNKILTAGLHFTGSPMTLNEISANYHLPKSSILTEEEDRAKKEKAQEEHWLAVMPEPIRPFWNKNWDGWLPGGEPPGFKEALAAFRDATPDRHKQIRILLAWYGSGVGLWNGYPLYEDIVAIFIQQYPFAEVSEIVRTEQLNDAELRGAARLFAISILGNEITKDRKILINALTESLKASDEWAASMPKSIKPLWTDAMWYSPMGFRLSEVEINKFLTALKDEFPDTNQRIRVLLGWYGSSMGVRCDWCAKYEQAANDLLLKFPGGDLKSAMQTQTLTDKQLDGAARLMADFFFQRDRPRDISNLSPAFKSTLLAHIHQRKNSKWEQFSAAFK